MIRSQYNSRRDYERKSLLLLTLDLLIHRLVDYRNVLLSYAFLWYHLVASLLYRTALYLNLLLGY